MWSASNSRAADAGLALDNEGFLQARAGDDSVPEQLAGPGNHLIVVPGSQVRLCADDGTVLWRGGQHIVDNGGEVMTTAPRPVTPAAVEAPLNAGCTPIVRTDFADDHAWESAWRDITMPREYWDDDFVLEATLVAMPELEGWTSEDLATLLSHSKHDHLLIVDTVTLASSEHPVLVVEVDPEREQPRSFRATSRPLVNVEIQLAAANLDWEDFSEGVDPDGVLRASGAD